MVLSILWLASVPTVGYSDQDVAGSMGRNKLQRYIAEAVAQTKGEGGGSKAASQGLCFGSPLPTPAMSDKLGASSLLQLPPPGDEAALGQKLKQQRGRWRGSGGRSGNVWQDKGEVSSPTAITSPRAGSESTASLASTPAFGSLTPDSASDCLARAASSAVAAAAAARQAGAAARQPGDETPSPAGSLAASFRAPDCRSLGSLTPSSSFSESQPERTGSGGIFAASSLPREPQEIDVRFLIQRLREPRQTGQVCTWGWEHAARLSHRRRSMPTELFAALWAATEASAGRCHPQDVLGMLECWLTLQHTCPRHFRLRVTALESLTTYSIPTACKRMGEGQLGQLALLCCDIALHRSEGGAMVCSGQGPSARDLMQPIFALAAAELAWRCCNQMRYVSPQTLSALHRASSAWRWKVVRHRDSPQLAALKEATAKALALLQGHSPA